MFHPCKKESSYLRAAIFKSYKEKCVYCGQNMQQRAMHIDHIIPSNMRICRDDDVLQYLEELENDGFVVDCVENYLPSCSACNIGKGNRTFSASNLRFYHEQAKKHVEDILKRIEQLELQSEEYFYEPIDPTSWDELDFSYQRNISHAIMGYRLTSADVSACPRFPQVERMIKQLSIVDYVVLQGQTGCGKSVSIYQAAYDFYKQGWRVYRYKFVDGITIPRLPQNTENSLYIIDDAQLLPNSAIDLLTNQVRPNRKIIFAKTVSDAIQADTVLLTNRDAVNLLYQDFTKRKDEILPIVQQCDKRIGINFLDSPIERRLENAKNAATPWQFNYTLRGGWQTIKEQYQVIATNHNCGMLAAIIAAFQIMQLDNAVDYKWLCAWLQKIDVSLLWTDEDLRYLVSQKIVCSEDDVRIVHLESAKAILVQYLEKCNWDNDKLQNVIEQAFLENRIIPLGLVWLCNSIRSYTWHLFDKWLISEKMVAFAFENLEQVTAPDARMGLAYFMEKVFSMDFEKNGHWYFCNNKRIILDWVEHACSENVHAYSRLVNTVYNTNHNEHKAFVSCVNWKQLFASLDAESEPNLYSWGELINRLTAFLPRGKDVPFKDMLHSTIDKLVIKTNINNISGLSDFLSQIVYLSSRYVHEVIRNLAPVYHTFLLKETLHATDIFTTDFLGYICGIGFFARRPSKDQRQTAMALVNQIPEKELAHVMSTCYPRDWNKMYDIMCLIGRHDRAKVKRIVTLIDTCSLSEMVKDAWDDPHDIVRACSALSIGDNNIATKFIEDNRGRIKKMYSPLIMIAPRCAVDLFNKGVAVDLMTEHWWECSCHALSVLIQEDASIAKAILRQNLPTVAERLNSISTCYMEESHCLKFVQLIHEFDQTIFDELVNQIDVNKMNDSWEKSYEGSYKQKQTKPRYDKLLELLLK